MCSVFGAVGNPMPSIVDRIRANAGDRGRDGGRSDVYLAHDGTLAVLGNWRATPTTEVVDTPAQPYDGVVHNGTIANDHDLGIRPGEVDSMVLPRILDRSSLEAFRDTVQRIVGSYAIATWTGSTVYLACNYKPVHYWSPDGVTTYFSSMARHFDGVVPPGQAPVKMAPYTVMDLRTGQSLDLRPDPPRRAVVVASGGLDSTTVATILARDGFDVHLLHVRYGCRAEGPEVRAVEAIAQYLNATHSFVDLDYRQFTTSGVSLLDPSADIAPGITGAEYAHDWVPARNLVMMAMATAYAEANGFHLIALGNNLEEAGAYPDNEEEMTVNLNRVLPNAVRDGYDLRITAPVGHLMKHEIVARGLAIDAPFHLTWSCYRGGDRHCGECGPCFMRTTAFSRNGVQDPVFQTR